MENFSENLFLEEHTIHLKIFCFEHSGRIFMPPKLYCSLTSMVPGFILCARKLENIICNFQCFFIMVIFQPNVVLWFESQKVHKSLRVSPDFISLPNFPNIKVFLH